jgi:hypothetical protein
LRRYLTRVIDSHQSCGVSFLIGVQASLRNIFRGIAARGAACRRSDGSQGIICADEQFIEWGQLTAFHATNYSVVRRAGGILRDLFFPARA